MSDAKPTSKPTSTVGAPAAISGIDVMRGVGAQEAKSFWADAWDRVIVRRGAQFAILWIGLVAFLAIFAPVLASAHPWRMETLASDGSVTSVTWPLVANLSPTDWLLMIGFVVGVPWVFIPFGEKRGMKRDGKSTAAQGRGEPAAKLAKKPIGRAFRLGILVVALLQAGLTIILTGALTRWADKSDIAWLEALARSESGPWPIALVVAGAIAVFVLAIPTFDRLLPRAAMVLGTAALAIGLSLGTGGAKLINFERYIDQERAGEIRATWTLIPWSPQYTRSDMVGLKPGSRVEDNPKLEEFKGTAFGSRHNWLGTDALGGDVLAQMLWACRLSISIGLVSTGISLLIGVTIGAVMGYFGGWIDMLLFRVVEIFMAVPVLFLLIVAAGVLPRDTYVMMAIIGCFSWTGAARFTRAEFLKLRKQDFVQAAQATGLPLRAILFRHMLPNGVTPVLVDASFAIAAAITVEATLSFLGLGPDGQASWGKLLSSATAATGTFVWWLAVFPGLAIFLSVLSYNLLGEALRDAIDPKLRKAAH
jgi:peptide/nickel transport system permease protein